jgi:GLPGLI family protein
MFKHFIRLTFFLLFPLLLNSQTKGGKITYKYLINADNYLKKKSNNVNLVKTLSYINNSLREAQSKLKFELVFNDRSSIYYMKSYFVSEGDKSMKYAIIFNEGQNEYYLDKKNNIKYISIEAYGERFNIVNKSNTMKWVTTNKTKKIGKYLCYKATTTKVTKNPKGVFKKQIIAWFTPEISFNYGPKGYDGLPGLILELQEGTLLYYASKIELKTNEKIKVRKPKKGKTITMEEFNELGVKVSKKRQNKI